MAVSRFSELLDHVGHEVECVAYAHPNTPEDVVNVAVECITCGGVLFDFDQGEGDG